MNYILFDAANRVDLLPFTFTRPVAEIRVGILTFAERWKKYLNADISYATQSYLGTKYPRVIKNDNTFINGSIVPTQELISEINQLAIGQALTAAGVLLAVRLTNEQATTFNADQMYTDVLEAKAEYLSINKTCDIFALNDKVLRMDFNLLTHGRKSQPISSTNQTASPENIFIEEGAKVEFSILNASTGPIYIGKDAEVMEGCKIRGPFAMCDHSGLKMDAKIYGATTLGPHCKAGGELNNVVMFGYSNKGHDGFLGNAVIGEWCNLGADTNNSNLKNTYEEVKLWNYRTERFERTGLTFCGLMMADHAKCGINTMFNTGTVVGVGANIFGAGFPRNFVPSFAWGGAQGFETFQLNKFYKTAEAMCSRRNVVFTETDKEIIKHVFDQSAKYRFWERSEANPS